MSYENLRLDVSEGVATLTLDRPKALNALNSATFHELEAALTSLPDDTRALILTGAGEKAFVAGADIAEMADYGSEQGRAFSALGQRVMALFEASHIPTIAAVNGFALGGGLELALCCDLIYASENAQLGLPEVGLGVIPGFGGTQRLTRAVGAQRARELVFTARRVKAEEAKAIGLVLDVVPAGELLAHCRKVAQSIAKAGPLAISQAKRVMRQGADVELTVANMIEQQAFGALFGTEDKREGMQAFLEKRPPAYKAR
ncbi:MAG TPA: enoyl-CoA hydratase-related protein [Myxococcaceae bacterium]|nr:enoyl-CoA hydratase-related protein [Myxococcaceae bacterium]